MAASDAAAAPAGAFRPPGPLRAARGQPGPRPAGRDAEAQGAARLGGYRRARRRAAWRAFLPVLPLLAFLVATFVLPVAVLLWRSVESPEVAAAMPNLAAALGDWDGAALPPDAAATAIADDIRAGNAGLLAQAARRLNQYEPGFRSLLLRTARAAPPSPSSMAALAEVDRRWAEPATWRLLQRAARTPTPDYLLAALDRRVDGDGRVVPVAPDQRVYLAALWRTVSISGAVTVICLLLGYPVAYLLATTPPRASSWLMILVIVPFWTSLLVRTTAWYVILQPGGVVNNALRGLGLVAEPVALVFNRTGVLIGMTHVLLPFMILAIYAVMKGVSPVYTRAALSLGAHPAVAFVRVYLPLTLPGVGAGVFLVFISALGYYITPALLGGAGDEMISQLIANQMDGQLNWGLAGALSVYLVLVTFAFYLLFNRIVGVDRLRIG